VDKSRVMENDHLSPVVRGIVGTLRIPLNRVEHGNRLLGQGHGAQKVQFV